MILGYGYCVKGCIIRITHCHYVKLNNKYRIDYETKISIHIIYFDFNNQYIGVLSEQPPYKGFKYVEDLSVFTHDFIINYDKNSKFGYTLTFDVHYTRFRS